MKKIKQLLPVCIALLSIHFSYAQTAVTTTPDASPKAKVMQTIGLTDVAIVYHRPASGEPARRWRVVAPAHRRAHPGSPRPEKRSDRSAVWGLIRAVNHRELNRGHPVYLLDDPCLIYKYIFEIRCTHSAFLPRI